MIALIILLAVIAVALIWFVAWFFSCKASGRCPLCVLKQYTRPVQMTIDPEEDEDYSNGTALTPPMGWSSWNTFRQNIDEELIYDTAKAMKDSGLADCGYNFINLDDCWQSSGRDKDGMLQHDLTNFRHGIRDLVTKINALGLKVGIYSSNGAYTCEDLPASLGNELLDARTFASWGCELLKYDFCHNEIIRGNAPLVTSLAFARPGEKDFVKLTADDAAFTGMARKTPYKDVPEGSYISYLNHGAGQASFSFEVTTGGKHVLTINYHKVLMHQTLYLQVKINGRLYEADFPKKANAFSKTSRLQLMVELQEGMNTVTICNPVATRADSAYVQYRRMGAALKEASKEWAAFTKQPEKPITFSICEWGTNFPWRWGRKAGNLWRTTPDINASWASIRGIYEHNVRLYKYAGLGAWNDPDMLEVGNGRLTYDENKAHFSLWCMMAAPLILGNDIRQFVQGGRPVESDVLKIVTNKAMINVDQDALGKQAKRIKTGAAADILAKPLADGAVALCFFNKTKKAKSFTFDIDSLCADEYLNFAKSEGTYKMEDLWDGGETTGRTVTCTANGHGVCVLKISACAEEKAEPSAFAEAQPAPAPEARPEAADAAGTIKETPAAAEPAESERSAADFERTADFAAGPVFSFREEPVDAPAPETQEESLPLEKHDAPAVDMSAIFDAPSGEDNAQSKTPETPQGAVPKAESAAEDTPEQAKKTAE